MVDFIRKLKSGMYTREIMNVVLEHLGVLQVKIFNLKNRLFNDSYFILDSCIKRYR